MKASSPWVVFLPLIASLFVAAAIAPSADVCPAGDCLLPGVEYLECTPTPEPRNPRKYIAGSNGLAETGAMGHYNWGPYLPVRSHNPDYEHIPMIRDWDDLTEQILSQLTVTTTQAALGGNSDWVMGPNEPDLAPPAGSDMTVDEVVRQQALTEALFPGTNIASPAYSQYSYQTLEVVRTRFIQVYGRPPRWDAIAFHCYFVDSAASCTPVVDWYVAKAEEWGVEQVWCTEFAALATTGSAGPNWAPAVASGSAFIDYMEAVGVDRYFWFGHCQEYMPYYACELVYDGGALTPLGEMYRNGSFSLELSIPLDEVR